MSFRKISVLTHSESSLKHRLDQIKLKPEILSYSNQSLTRLRNLPSEHTDEADKVQLHSHVFLAALNISETSVGMEGFQGGY